MSGTAATTVRTGWGSKLAMIGGYVLLFEAISGFLITFASFHSVIEWGVLLHTLVGVVTLCPVAWYLAVHWADYRGYAMSHVVFLGYVGAVGLIVCADV